MDLATPFVISTGTIVAALFVSNIFWIKRLIHKVDKIDELSPLLAKVAALEQLTLNLNNAVSKMQGYLEGAARHNAETKA